MMRVPPDDDWSSPAIGEDPRAPLPVHEVRPVDQAVRLARHFDERWAELGRKHRELRGIRASSRGPAIGYLRKVMIPDKGVELTEAYIDAFVTAVADGEVGIKDGQFAWERFTAWWGRVPIDDPAIKEADRDYARRAIEAVRRQRGIS